MLGSVDGFSDKWLAFLWEQTVPQYWQTCFSIPMKMSFCINSLRKAKESLLGSSIYHTVILMTLFLLIIKDLGSSFLIFTPKELTISETTESTSVASYLDLHFNRDNSNNITTKLDDKHDSYVWLLHCELSFHVKQYSISTSLWCLCISAHSLCPLLLKL